MKLARGALLLLWPFAGLAAGQPDALPPPIEVGSVEETTPAGPVRGHWARVRLDHPAVEIVVTAPLPPQAVPHAPAAEAVLQPLDAWMQANGVTLGVNANFFSRVLPPETPDKPPAAPPAVLPVDLVGLSISDGRVVSPPRIAGDEGDPAVLILPGGRARIARVSADGVAGVEEAVAGIGASDNLRQPGTLLVTDGRNTGATARVAPAVRHPRTAAGTDAEGRILVLLVIDGRQPEHSVGVTLPELADHMIRLGAVQAVNLDGGGSSSFLYLDPDGRRVQNRPSDGRWRPVGNHLGVRLRR